jgi:NitT/TauT family transport system ATP-binding protein
MSAAIEVRGVTKAYPMTGGQERIALEGVNLEVSHGEFVCLLGPSGCGKTTLLNILSGLDRPDAGTVVLRSVDGERQPISAYMFQESRLLPWLSVSANIEFVLTSGRPGRHHRDAVRYWLDRVGLAGRGDDFPRQLSIGQQQRVAVARALAIRPDVLFMDEPFSALDELTASRMREELVDLWSETRATVMFVTHNPLEATYLADRIVVMTGSPGSITAVHDIAGQIERPRDGNAVSMWEASRCVVATLTGDHHAA